MAGYDPKPIVSPDSLDLVPDKFKNRMSVRPSRPRKTIQSRYMDLKPKRDNFLERAKTYSKMTIPALFTESDGNSSGDNGAGFNQHGWQSLGAQAVTHLANKLMMTLYPPSRSFFRLAFSKSAKEAMYATGVNETQLNSMLANAEEEARLENEKRQFRVASNQSVTHLIVAGNSLEYLPETGDMIAYPLDRYVVVRDKRGRWLELILEEEKIFETLPDDVRLAVKLEKPSTKPSDNLKLYTRVLWNSRTSEYDITQEICEVPIGDKQSVKEDANPFNPVCWNRLYGESYGRGHVESNAGDLYVYQFLSEAIAKGAALMSEVKFLVKRGAASSPTQLASAPSGEYLYGEKDDVSVVQLEKYQDFQSVQSVLEIYSRRIGQAFIMASAVRRDAERVTTVELRQDANELETSLGGTYSLLASTKQRWHAQRLLNLINFRLPVTDVMPIITTGLESLGKLGDLDKIDQFSQMMSIPNQWSPVAQDHIKWSDYMSAIASYLGMETPWIMNEDEYNKMMQQRQQQQQQQQALEAAAKAAPQMMKGADQQ